MSNKRSLPQSTSRSSKKQKQKHIPKFVNPVSKIMIPIVGYMPIIKENSTPVHPDSPITFIKTRDDKTLEVATDLVSRIKKISSPITVLNLDYSDDLRLYISFLASPYTVTKHNLFSLFVYAVDFEDKKTQQICVDWVKYNIVSYSRLLMNSKDIRTHDLCKKIIDTWVLQGLHLKPEQMLAIPIDVAKYYLSLC